MAANAAGTTRTAEAELRSFLARFDAKAQRRFRAVRAAVRRRFPAANELAYDYASHVLIAYSPTERGIDAFVSIAARPDGVRMYFNHGPRLPDPTGLLLGSGRQTRYIEVESASQLARPEVEALMRAASELAGAAMPSGGKGAVMVRGTAANRKPRRKPAR